MIALLWTLRAVVAALCITLLGLWAMTWVARRRHQRVRRELAAAQAQHALALEGLRRARRDADLNTIGLFCAMRLAASQQVAKQRRGTELLS
jgi:hypothetical protein